MESFFGTIYQTGERREDRESWKMGREKERKSFRVKGDGRRRKERKELGKQRREGRRRGRV